MKSSFVNLLVLQGATTNAHYLFSKIHINGVSAGDWQYFRKLPEQPADPNYGYDTRINPVYNVESINIRCNRGGATAGAGVDIATLRAGDTIGFGRTNDATFPNPPYNNNDQFFHSGPANLYLSKAPANLESYTGDGDWFKIGQYGAKSETQWALAEGISWINFTVPKTTPPGNYLMRIEHMFMRSPYPLETTQFYVGCAHAEISGPGGGNPSPLVKFPGAYKNNDSYVQIPPEWGSFGLFKSRNLMSPKWVNPGPSVWSD